MIGILGTKGGSSHTIRRAWPQGVGMIVLTIGIFTLGAFIFLSGAQGETITVDDDGEGDYETIKEAINNASAGDTIRVWEGEYRERISVKKKLELIGNGSACTIIDGKGGTVVGFETSDSMLKGFHLTNGSSGISMYYSEDNIITNNTISSNSDFGIRSSFSNYNEIYSTRIIHNSIGIKMDHSHRTIIRYCTFEENTGYAIQLVGGYSSCSVSWIHYNAFLYNNGATDEYNSSHVQARDDTQVGMENYWNTGSEGNYWRDWTKPDSDGNGIVDHGYEIEGQADAVDNYPLAEWHETYYVDDDSPEGGDGSEEYPYNKIQDAIENASDGDTIRVWEGIYSEAIIVNITINIIGNGSDQTKIEGIRSTYIFTINADGVQVKGFKLIEKMERSPTYGIQLNGNHSRILENIIVDTSNSILIYGSNNTIQNNNIELGDEGIMIHGSNNTVMKNYLESMWQGIIIKGSFNTVMNNELDSCSNVGIHISESIHNALKNNTMRNTGISINGRSIDEWDSHDIDSENTVNGKPVLYLRGCSGDTVPKGIGQIILANCSRIAIFNQNFSYVTLGISLGFSDNITITNNSCSNNIESGIYISHSQHIVLENNTCSDNGWNGIIITYSSHLDIVENTCSDNYWNGIQISTDCDNTNIRNNNLTSNDRDGLALINTDINLIEHNEFMDNARSGLYIWSSSKTNILNNKISRNKVGIVFNNPTPENEVHYNNISDNYDLGINVTHPTNYTTDASFNWWGDNSGPYHGSENPDGKGDRVSDYVEFDPWLREPVTIYVDDDAPEGGDGSYNWPFSRIQDAIDAALDEDIIRVWEGTYYENVVVYKSLDIVGNGSGVTFIDGGGDRDVVAITADGTNLSGFRISGSNDNFFYAGIRIDSNRSSIFSNELIQNNRGMYFSPDSHDNMIENNVISSNLIGMSLHESMNNMVIGNICSNNTSTGISLKNSSNNTFTDNTCSDNRNYGISLGEFSNNNTISNNICMNNNRSLRFFDSYHNLILNNRVRNTFFECVLIKDSGYNLFTNNTIESPYKGFAIVDSHHITLERTIMTDCGIDIDGSALKYWNTHSIDTTNRINGNPIVYLKDATNLTIPEGAGEVILANCTSMIVENQTCSNIKVGIQIGYSREIIVTNNIIENNQFEGIHLFNSHFNVISKNTCENNVNYGIKIDYSNNNFLVNNICTNNKHFGIMLDHSHNNTLSDNLCLDNKHNDGIKLTSSDHNVLFNNTSSNNRRGIYLGLSNHNTINFNTCSNNSDEGLWTGGNEHNIFSNNIASENDNGIYITDSVSNVFTNNSFLNNSDIGIALNIYSKENNFTDNTVSGNTIGFEFLFYSSDNIVHYNNIFDNREYGIDATNNSGQIIDATYNWWGHDSGPYHSENNSEGKGDNVTDNVEFDPWVGKSVTIYVDDNAPDGGDGSIGKPFNRIQDAIDAAEEGDTIHVAEGTYYEKVVIDKGLTLKGAGSENTIIHRKWSGDVVTITADLVNISGFTVSGAEGGSSYPYGLRLEGNYSHIFDNVFRNNSKTAMILQDSNHNFIMNNTYIGYGSSTGIYVGTSNYNNISGNSCDNFFYGIYVSYSHNNILSLNNCTNNNQGIHISRSSFNEISNNTLSNNIGTEDRSDYGMGIKLYINAESNVIVNNTIQDNLRGIFVQESANNNTALNNIITGNSRAGIDVNYHIDEFQAVGNTITNNEIGIIVHRLTERIEIHENEIYYNKQYGIRVIVEPYAPCDATMNWWGDVSGPYHPNDNPNGRGDEITDNVIFEPWIGKEEDPKPTPLADLTGVWIECGLIPPGGSCEFKSTIMEGEMIQLSAEVWNKGDLDAENINVSFYRFYSNQMEDYQIQDYVIVDHIPAGAYTTVTFEWNGTGMLGSHQIKFLIDPNDNIEELNEDDNLIHGSVYVKEKGVWAVEISAERNRLGVEKDDIVNIKLTIINTGEFEDSYQLSFWRDDIRWTMVISPGYDFLLAPGESATAQLTIYVPDNSTNATIRIWVNSTIDYNVSDSVTIDVSIDDGPDTRIPIPLPPPTLPFVVVAIGAGILLTFFITSTGLGRFTFFSLIFPLYTRLTKRSIEQDIEEHTIRGRIYQFIIDNPGSNYNRILRSIEAGNGTTSYHLKVLEKNGFVKSIKKDFNIFYFKTGMKFPYRLQSKLTFTELEILNTLQSSEDLSVSHIAALIDKSIQTAGENIKMLERNKLVESSRKDRQKVCRITDKGKGYLVKYSP